MTGFCFVNAPAEAGGMKTCSDVETQNCVSGVHPETLKLFKSGNAANLGLIFL